MKPSRLLVTLDCAHPVDLAEFWVQALDYRVVGGDGETFVVLGPADNSPVPPLYLQRVAEQKVVKNRQHLDLCSRDPEQMVSRLEAIGATRLGLPFGGRPWRWQVMRDPEGNEFCVVREDPDDLTQTA
jgi:hypothetical protein